MTLAEIEDATAPARWLLERGETSLALTQTHALTRAVVREAAERWPLWWDAELFGPPHREADLAVLGALHDGLRRLRLLRRQGRRLHTTARGGELARDPTVLLALLTGDLGGGDPFSEAVAHEVTDALARHDHQSHDDLLATVAAMARRDGWRTPDGQAPSEREVSWVLGDVLCRGEAYGIIARHPDPARPRLRGRRITLTPAGQHALGATPPTPAPPRAPLLIFDAVLLNARGVHARLAVRADQHLTFLHDAIQDAFGFYDDHLYSFWLDGAFWGDQRTEFTAPDTPDEGTRTADVPLAQLDLAPGATLAYIFDFGDEWRVRLTLRATQPADDGRYPRVLQRTGQAPPQYPALNE